MSGSSRDAAAIWDMAKAIREIQEFTANFSEDSFLETLWVQRAVERNFEILGFEILGEASRRVSMEFQQAHPEIAWRNTIALRNLIAHRYERVDYRLLWQMIQDTLPTFLATLDSFLQNMPEMD